MSIERRRLMLAYGATFDLTPRKGMKGAIERANQLLAETPGAWIPQQFENPANVAVHARTTAQEILKDFADTPIDVLITGVGTGGHLTGSAEELKKDLARAEGLCRRAGAVAGHFRRATGAPSDPGDRRGLHPRQPPHPVDRRRDPGRCRRRQGMGAPFGQRRRPARGHQLGRDACRHRAEAAGPSRRQPRAGLQLRYRRTLSFRSRFPAGVRPWRWKKSATITMIPCSPAGSPGRRGQRAGRSCFPTIMNVNAPMERRAQMLADAGYVALIADFYGQPVADFAASHALAETLRADVRHYRDRIAAAVATLRAHEAAADLPIGAIGFCMGGQAVLELARDGADLDVVVSFHGILATGRPAQPGDTIRPRILICHGDKDPLVPRPQVWRSGRKWTAPMPTGTFMPTPAPSMASPIRTVTRGLPAIGYDASADRQSWAAMLSLLSEVWGERTG
jgi:dienelactone hydrolase